MAQLPFAAPFKLFFVYAKGRNQIWHYALGARVGHIKWGTGTIISVSASPVNIMEVEFDSLETHTISIKSDNMTYIAIPDNSAVCPDFKNFVFSTNWNTTLQIKSQQEFEVYNAKGAVEKEQRKTKILEEKRKEEERQNIIIQRDRELAEIERKEVEREDEEHTEYILDLENRSHRYWYESSYLLWILSYF
jgi:hypothetical protein